MSTVGLLFGAVQVRSSDVPIFLMLLWGTVIGGGLLSLALMYSGTSSGSDGASNLGRTIGRIALIAIIPAVTLSLSAASS